MLPMPARLAALKTLGDVTASELGKLAGMSTHVVRMIERGKRGGNAETIRALQEVLGDETGWLLTGIGDPPSKETVLAAVERARAKKRPPEDGRAA